MFLLGICWVTWERAVDWMILTTKTRISNHKQIWPHSSWWSLLGKSLMECPICHRYQWVMQLFFEWRPYRKRPHLSHVIPHLPLNRGLTAWNVIPCKLSHPRVSRFVKGCFPRETFSICLRLFIEILQLVMCWLEKKKCAKWRTLEWPEMFRRTIFTKEKPGYELF